jgi:hypothetical protein
MYGELKMDDDAYDERRFDMKKVVENKHRIESENLILKKQIEMI